MEHTKSIYIDQPQWIEPVKKDDFIVCIGAKKTNSIYHVAEVKSVVDRPGKLKRYYLRVYDSDLTTMMQREVTQKLIPLTWYKRKSKKR